MHTHRSFEALLFKPSVILLDLLNHLRQSWMWNCSVGRHGHSVTCSTTSFLRNKASSGVSQSQVCVERSMTDDKSSWKYIWEERKRSDSVLILLLPEVLFQENQLKFCLQSLRGSS